MNEIAPHRLDYSDLIATAERYCDAAGIKLSTLGSYAVGNSRWFDDRRAGRPCLNTTIDRVIRYMADNAPEQRTEASR